MVLSLIAKFANSNNGSAGPYVVEEDRRVPLRDWLCDSLVPMAKRDARRLAIVWGTHPIVTKDASDVDDMAFRAAKFALREDFAVIGDRVIVVAGVPFGTPGATNMVRIAYVTREHAALV